jgi:hypothetical protein
MSDRRRRLVEHGGGGVEPAQMTAVPALTGQA